MVMLKKLKSSNKPALGMLVLAASLTISVASAQTAPQPTSPRTAVPNAKASAAKPYRFRSAQLPKSAREYYGLVWGVDDLSIKSVESGEIIRFSYRVLDPAKAKVLNNKKNEPALVDPQAGVSLVVPSLEKVGQLRQSSTPEAGKVYWMAFSNKGRKVKPGHRVSVVIGTFKAEGLPVQ
jgi:hypothetical protein